MKAFEIFGDIDEQHRLNAQVPVDLPAGPVRIIVLIPNEDDAGVAWSPGIATEWKEDLADSRQEIYTLDDGRPLNARE